ncbi:LemA family protein [Neofamilia massiliensis]|uniref:LemA family protein n=1 Tax=Neofamilia massiliensis TaxID=1673724 RepID=UPI0006BB9186|nr:LemA family protein [Neofamilia massiliensis]
MKKGGSKFLIILIIVVVIGLGLFNTYNGLVVTEEKVNQSYADLQTAVQRRADLIPNLVNTVKGYATHEEETLTKITEARSKVTSASNPEELSKANAELTRALGDINVVVEAYPELKANENFIQLQDELAGTENRIAVARKDYNGVVNTFNSQVRRFPTSIFAKILGFSPKDYFEADPGSEKAPTVDFGYIFVKNYLG